MGQPCPEGAAVPTAFLLVALLAGCHGDTGFSTTPDDVDPAEGNGQIEVTPPDTLVFIDLEPTIPKSLILLVTSVGDDNLTLYSVRVTDSGSGVFHLEEKNDIVLQPGDTREFPVTAILPDANPAEGMVRIECNDPDGATLYVGLQGSAASADTGDTGDTAP